MYQFSVSQPINRNEGIKLLRSYSGLSVHEIVVAIENQLPVINLNYRQDIVELEFEDWISKVKYIHSQLENNFEKVQIGYSFSQGHEIEFVDRGEFYKLLQLELDVHEQEYD